MNAADSEAIIWEQLFAQVAALTREVRRLQNNEAAVVGGGGSGAAALADESYLVLDFTSDLSNERKFVDGDGLHATDGGAGGDYTLDIDLHADLSANLLGITGGELDLDSQTANLVFAAPDGGAGKPDFRALEETDIPAAFLTETEGDARYWRYARIIRTDSAGAWTTYDGDGTGLAAAIAAASAAETLWLPARTFTGNHTFPANVTVRGMSRADTVLSGQIILSDGARGENLSITRTANDASDLRGVLVPTTGTAYLDAVTVSVTQNGGGTGTAIYASSRGGKLELHGGCDIYGSTADIG